MSALSDMSLLKKKSLSPFTVLSLMVEFQTVKISCSFHLMLA